MLYHANSKCIYCFPFQYFEGENPAEEYHVTPILYL